MKFRFALMIVVVLGLVAAGIVYGQRDEVNPNRVVLRHKLQPLSQTTQGQLQVIDKTGKPLGECPLEHTSVKADVAGFVARVDVTQEFVNPLDTPIEAVYVFPLPSDCAVDRMEMTVGDRTIKGDIKRREEARQIYDTAKANGQVASLLDQERPNIFTQSVANIMPGARVKITISFVDVLKYEDGQYEFVFPMVVGPRYMPGAPTGQTGTGTLPDTDKVPDASKISPPITPEGTRAGHDVSVEVNINAGVTLGDVKSVLHEVNVARTGDIEARVTLKDLATIPNKDFILRYRVAGDDVKTGLLPNTRGAGDGYFSFVIVPPKTPTAAQIAPKEMIFVIDTSGSQMGWPIEKAKETMKLCIEKMNPGDTFNLMAFSNDVTPLFAKAQPNTAENRAFAQDFLMNRLGSGGTEMMKAIDAALGAPADPKRLRIVCFMTDGYVGNDMEILDAIKKKIGNARLFSFGIGNSTNRFLLDGMARLGRGAVEYVTLQEEGKGAAERYYNRISKPVLTDIQIDWGGLPVYDMYPQQIPDLFAQKPVIIQGRYDKPMKGTIIVRGSLGGRPWEERLQVSLPGHEDENQALPSLWARSRITELTEQDYLGIQQGNPDPKIKEDIIKVALDYQLMSQFTSFVAVEEKIVNKEGKPTTIAVPVEMPEGVSYEGVQGERSAADASKRQSGSLAAPLAPAPMSAGGGFSGAKGVQGPAGPMGAASTNGPTSHYSYSNSAVPSGKPQAVTSMPAMSTTGAVVGQLRKTPQNAGGGFGGVRAKSSVGGDGIAWNKDDKYAEARNMKTEDRKKFLIEARLDPLLRGLPAKLKASGSGNLVIPGKLQVVHGQTKVSIKMSDFSEANLAKLRKLGVKISASNKMLAMVVGLVSVDKLEEIAQLEFVTKIAPVVK